MPVGSCACGAVYACDETGHNVGAAMVEALVFGCNMDWDLAWSLLPEEDYTQEIVEHYDYVRHLMVPSGCHEARRIWGILLFVKFHEDVLEVTSEKVQKRLEKASAEAPESTPGVSQGREGKPLTKKEIEKCVRHYEPDPILETAGYDKRLIRHLQRLLYSGDDLFRGRAAEILGHACAIIGDKEPGSVSKLLSALFYAISDTAAFTWGAFEAIGEIISHKPKLFAGYVPQLYQYLADETRRPQALRTLARIAKARPDLLRKHTFHFFPYLEDPDPRVRGYTVYLLGNLGAHEAREDLDRLAQDSHEVSIYEKGALEKKTVARLVQEALEKL